MKVKENKIIVIKIIYIHRFAKQTKKRKEVNMLKTLKVIGNVLSFIVVQVIPFAEMVVSTIKKAKEKNNEMVN